jgi:E3 ubiquitin-protein ligase NEDD4
MDAVSYGSFHLRAPTNLCRNNDITDALELTFATDDERFGETVSIELKPGGDDIEVTNENKGEYVE